MPFIRKIISTAVIGLAFTTLGLSQTATPSSTPADGPGLVGKRYLGIDLFTVDYRGTGSNNAFGEETFVRTPIGRYFDLTGGVDFAQRTNRWITDNWKDVFIGANAHTQFHTVTPFVSTGITYSKFTRSIVGTGNVINDDTFYYGFGAGIELPLSPVASLSIGGGASSATESDSSFFWSYGLGGVYWCSPRVATVGDISWHETVSVSYSVGLRLTF